MHKPRGQAAMGFIFVTLLIDVMGFGIIIPVLPSLIQHLIHGSISDAAPYAGLLTFAYASMQFIFAPMIGNLSDKFGRRPGPFWPHYWASASIICFWHSRPLYGWLFLGRVIAGVTGAASFT